MIYNGFSELVGNTPLFKPNNFGSEFDTKILTKLEYFNPSGSIKDRIAKGILLDLLDKKIINKDTEIIEPTSGNTGIGLAAIGASLNLNVTIIMPETMSIERRNIIKAYGAKLVLTDGSKGMKGAIEKANEINKNNENSYILGQFENEVNPLTHYLTTGPEIWNDTLGNIDIFVAGVGTGGTISGVGKYLKEKNPNIKIVAVEPKSSAVLSTGVAGPHKIQGIGAGFIPNTLDTSIYDEIIAVENEDAFATSREFAKKEGILVGISSGAALYASKLLSSDSKNAGKTIVVVLPDNGDRYFSTDIFQK